MSLVLAFGLSPLGQVPAYAAQKGGEPAQQEAPLQAMTNAGTPADAKKQFGEVWVTDQTVNKDYRVDLAESAWTDENQPVYNGNTERVIKFDVYDTNGSRILTVGETNASGSVDTAEYSIELKGPDGKVIAPESDGTYKYGKAGVYTATINGLDDYAHKTKEISFKVYQYDIAGMVFAPTQASGTMQFTGEDQALTYELATDDYAGFAATKRYWNDSDIYGANYKKDSTTELKITLSDEDKKALDVEPAIFTDAGYYEDATVTGTGNLTGTASAPFDVAQVELLGSADNADSTTAILTSEDDPASPKTVTNPGRITVENGEGGTGKGSAEVFVSAGKVDKPIELKYYIAGTGSDITDGDAKFVTLEEGKDYSVTYYEASSGKITKTKIAGALPSEVGDDYYAVIKTTMDSTNFKYISGNEIQVHCTVAKGGELSDVVASGTLASGTYMGGASAAADPKASGKFYATDGTDVTDLVGTNFTVNNDFKVATVNTAKTAQTSTSDKSDPNGAGYPIGAGTYTGTIKGAEAYAGAKDIPVTYVVEPRVAKEGAAKGDLKITVTPGAYNGGDYVDMVKGTNVKVEMYTTDTGKTQRVPSFGYSALDKFDTESTYDNWTVKYYDASGKRVSLPAETGEYTAVFSFDGNLKGTPDIEKKFTVGKGDATALVAGIRDKNVSNKDEFEDTEGIYSDDTSKKYTTYTSDPTSVFTGTSRALDQANLVLVDENDVEIDKNKLVGTEYTLSYAAGGSGASLDADGNPLTSGTYAVTATFTGNYEGAVTTTLTVSRLSLRNMTAAYTGNSKNDQAELQFEQPDGSWDTVYSTPATGSAIAPNVRVAIIDPKKHTEKTAKADVVDGSVYTATFSDNTEAGQAKVTLTSSSPSVTTSASAQAKAFTIGDAGKSLASASVALADKDGKAVSSIKYGEKGWTSSAASQNYLTLKTSLGGSPLVYAQTGVDAYTADVVFSNETVYKKDDTYYARTKGEYVAYTDEEMADWTTGTAAVDGNANYDGRKAVANITDSEGKSVTNVYSADDGSTITTLYKMDEAPDYAPIAGEVEGYTQKTVATAVAGTADEGYAEGNGKATVTFSKATVYTEKGKTDYYYAEVANVGTQAKSIATTKEFGGFEGAAEPEVTTSGDASALPTNYSVRIVDEKGVDVTGKFTVECAADPYTTVTVKGKASVKDKDGKVTTANYDDGFGSADAGEYTIVVGAGTAGSYSGRATAKFTVEKMDIADKDMASILYKVTRTTTSGGTPTTATTAYSLDDEWSIDYDAAAAGTVDGIVLAAEKAKTGKWFELAYEGVAGNLAEGTDYSISYEDNFDAGAAKVTFKGKGNYTGEVEKPFTIERAKLDAPGANKSGFVVNWLESAGFKYDKNANVDGGAYVAAYTGSAITPEFEVNLYENEDAVTPKGMLQEDYTVTWSNNTHVSYEYNGTNVMPYAKVKITATGNYEGSIEGTFQINPTDLYDNSAVTVTPVSDQVWTGGQVIPAVNVTLNGTALAQGTDYVVTLAAGDNGTDEGEHTALIASAGRGDVTVSTPIPVKYTIKKASEISYDLTGATVALSASKFTYNGKAQAPTVTGVTLKDGTLLDTALYTATIPSATGANTYTVSVKGATASVTGTATASFTIAKAANTLTVKAKKPSVKASKLKAKKATVKAAKAFSVTKNVSGGKVTYKKASGSKKVKVASTGKVTVKKGTKKGTYTVKVKATSKATANYTAKTTAAFKLKVKVK